MASAINTTDPITMLCKLSVLSESKTNPRKAFDDGDMKDLIASVKQHGVLQPILIRPLNGSGKYEVVAGARRYRAAKAAGLTEIPAVTRILTDAQAMELQIVENLQRRDVAPIDEALGYKALLDLRGEPAKGEKEGKPLYTVESIAQRLNKSTSYVWQRLKLADLIKPIQKKLAEDVITAGHAILAARLSADDQVRLDAEYFDPEHFEGIPSVRDLKGVIFREFYRSIDKAPFKTEDATLNPARGACSGCEYNSAVAQSLHEVPKGEGACCSNGACYEIKLNVHLQRQAAALKQKHPNAVAVSRAYSLSASSETAKAQPNVIPAAKFTEVKPNAKGAVPALVVDGRDIGKVIHIKASTEAAPNRSKEQERFAAEQRVNQLKADMAKEVRFQTLYKIAEAVARKGLDDVTLRELAIWTVDRGVDSINRPRLFGERFEKAHHRDTIGKAIDDLVAAARKQEKDTGKKSADPILLLLVGGMLAGAAASGYPEGQLPMMARHWKIDEAEIAKKVKAMPKFAQPLERATARLKAAQPKTMVKAKGGKARKAS